MSFKVHTPFLLSFQPPPEVTVSKINLTDRSKSLEGNNYFHCHREISQRTRQTQLKKEQSVESNQSSDNASSLHDKYHRCVKKKSRKKKKIGESRDNLLKE